MISIKEAQQDMNEAYLYGVPGIFASGSIWLIAGFISLLHGANLGMATLIFGGTLIFPLSVLGCKALGRAGKHKKGNPLAPLAIEGTIWMLAAIPIAIGASITNTTWFFPAMLMVIGGRYLTFNTLYGNRSYWLLGAVLIASAIPIALLGLPAQVGALGGGIIEYVFAMIIFKQAKTI